MSIFIHHGHSRLEIISASIPSPLPTDATIGQMINNLKSSMDAQLSLLSPDINQTLNQIVAQLDVIEAAGGVIRDNHDRYLLIHRRGHWDLPKGKIDPGETSLIAANREIEEETGVSNLELVSSLSPTYHIYLHAEKWILKKTYWFLFQTKNDQTLKLQKEEDIDDAKWMDKNQIRQIRNKIYPSLHPLLDEAIV